MELTTPAASVTAFRPPPGADVRRDEQQADLLDAGRRYDAVALPATLAGLVDRDKRGVWVYYRVRPQALASLAALIGCPPP